MRPTSARRPLPRQLLVLLVMAVSITPGAQRARASQDTPALPAPSSLLDPKWVQIPASPPLPLGRHVHSATLDPTGHRMLVFGGVNGNAFFGDLWSLRLDGLPTWSLLTPSGGGPTPRRGHTITYDPVRNRFLLFGGYDGSSTYKNDLWQLTFDPSPAWSQLFPTGTLPPGLYWHSAIYDPIRDRIIVFAGHRLGVPLESNDVYELSFADGLVWTKLTPSGSLPTPRAGHVAVFDPAGDRMIVFAGRRPAGLFLNDVWSLSLGPNPTWTQLSPSGAPPGTREGPAGIYDPVSGRLLAFGGWNGSRVLDDFWALSLSDPPAWQPITTLEVPAVRSGSSAVYDPTYDRLVLFGGNNTQALNDTWAFLRGPRPIFHAPGGTGDVANTVATVSEWAIADIRPNPSRSLVTFRLVSGSGPARASVFDASGRVVREWSDLRAQSAEHAVIWDGRTNDGHSVADGVYFLRLESGGSASTGKFVRVSR